MNYCKMHKRMKNMNRVNKRQFSSKTISLDLNGENIKLE